MEDAYVASTLTEEDYEEDEEDDYSDLDEDENELNSENLSPSGSPSKKRLSSRAVGNYFHGHLSKYHFSIRKFVVRNLKRTPIAFGRVRHCQRLYLICVNRVDVLIMICSGMLLLV